MRALVVVLLMSAPSLSGIQGCPWTHPQSPASSPPRTSCSLLMIHGCPRRTQPPLSSVITDSRALHPHPHGCPMCSLPLLQSCPRTHPQGFRFRPGLQVCRQVPLCSGGCLGHHPTIYRISRYVTEAACTWTGPRRGLAVVCSERHCPRGLPHLVIWPYPALPLGGLRQGDWQAYLRQGD